MNSTTEVATLQQLADLTGLDPTTFSHRKTDLPASYPVHTGANGRPHLCFPLDQIAEFILDRTNFLSDIECRLRLAMAPAAYRKPRCQSMNLKQLAKLGCRIVTNAQGEHIVVPYGLLADLDDDARAALAHEAATLGVRVYDRDQREVIYQTTPAAIPEGTQP